MHVSSSPLFKSVPVVIQDYKFYFRNTIQINENDVNKYSKILHTDSQLFFEIASRIYEIEPVTTIYEKNIGINPSQKEVVEETLLSDGTCLGIFLTEKDIPARKLQSAHFLIRNLTSLENQEKLIDIKRIEKAVVNSCKNWYLRPKQIFYVNFNNQPFEICYLNGKGKKPKGATLWYDQMKRKTKVDFKLNAEASFILVKKTTPSIPTEFNFYVSLLENKASKREVTPILLKHKKLKKKIRSCFSDQYLLKSDSKVFQYGDEETVEVVFESACPKKSKCKLEEQSVEKVWKISDQSIFVFHSTQADLSIVKRKPIPAKKVLIKLQSLNSSPSWDGIGNRFRNWVNVKKLKKEVKDRISIFTGKTNFKLFYNTFKYTISIDEVFPPYLKESGALYPTSWSLTDESEIHFMLRSTIDQVLVDGVHKYPLKEIEYHVRPVMGRRDDVPMVTFNKEDLIMEIQEKTPPVRCNDQRFTLDLEDGKAIDIRVDKIRFEEPEFDTGRYGHLGIVTKDTKIEFTFPHSEMLILETVEAVSLIERDPIQILEDLGLIGLNSEIIEEIELLITSICSDYKDDLGIKPPKGILISGPPGTGKTTFALGLKQILGVPDKNFVKIKPVDIHSKWVGESEKKLHKFFEPAINAMKTEKGKKERFILFFDEIEAICASRKKETSSYKKDFIGTLLNEMDGYVSYDNLLLIGTTNNPERIDSAFLRPGRFTNTLEFQLPNQEGRLKILKFYCKKIIEDALLDSSVDLNYYAKNTENYSGDHLKGLVDKAKNYAALRLDKKAKEKELTHPYVTEEDFNNALRKQNQAMKKTPSGFPSYYL